MSSNSGARRTQAERTAASDKAMFKAAIKLIAKSGPKEMTLSQVGKEAGFTGGLVSYRFGSKSGLLTAVADRIIELWSSRVLSSYNSGGIEFLLDMSSASFDAYRKRSDLLVALFRLMHDCYCSCTELQPHFQEFDNLIRERIVSNIKADVKAGKIRKNIDPESFAYLYIGAHRGIALQHFINPKAVDLNAAEDMVKGMCLNLLKK